MPKKFTTKAIKNRDALHPRSRKAAQLSRALKRSASIDTKKATLVRERHHPTTDMLTWFQLRLEDGWTSCDVGRVAELVQEYLERHKDELERVKVALRPGRPAPPRLAILSAVIRGEQTEYAQSGILIPDLESAENVRRLREWDGSYGSVALVKLARFREPPGRAATTQ